MSSPSKSISCSSEDENELRKGPWTHEEDDMLTKYIANHGEGRWNFLAKHSGLRRTGKSCRLRWLNYLKPDVKRGNLTAEEQLLIFELHSKWGNRWSKIAQQLPGRTDNEIKNFWRTRIQKQVRYLKIDTHETGFQGNVEHLWWTRFLQESKESSSPSAIPIQNQLSIPLHLDSVSQYSATETTQIPCQGTCMNGAGPNYLDQHEHNNSDSGHNNCSYNSASLESAHIPNMPQLLEYTTSFGINAYDSSYHANNNAYEMDAFNLKTAMVAEDMEYPIGDCQVSESNWVDKDFECSMWNMDELWQFRSIQQKQ